MFPWRLHQLTNKNIKYCLFGPCQMILPFRSFTYILDNDLEWLQNTIKILSSNTTRGTKFVFKVNRKHLCFFYFFHPIIISMHRLKYESHITWQWNIHFTLFLYCRMIHWGNIGVTKHFLLGSNKDTLLTHMS